MTPASKALVVVAAALFPALLVACPSDKDKDKEPVNTAPPPVTAAPAPTPTTELVPEDAGPDVADAADASDAKPVVGQSSLSKCCAAIKQNQKSAPPEQQALYGAAIALCNSGAIPPQFRNLPQCK